MCPLVWAEFLGLWHLTPAFCVLSSSLGMVMQAPKTYFLRPIKPPQTHLKPPSIPSPPQNELFPLPEFAQAVPLPECSHSVFAWLVPSQSSGPNARPLPRENSCLRFFRGFSLILFFSYALICFLQESYTIWYFVPECKFVMTGTTSVLFSGNYPLGLLLVKKFPFEHEVGWLTAFQFSCSECLKP